MLSRAMITIFKTTSKSVTLVALSYRGYWTSTGRPTQSGIETDAKSFLCWAQRSFPHAHMILWGQSIGAAVAVTALANHLTTQTHRVASTNGVRAGTSLGLNITGIILETPFVNIRRMLANLYPQKWLPYRHLWPFLRSKWDSERALMRMKGSGEPVPPILLLPAADDEVVPLAETDHLESLCKVLELRYERVDVSSALHHEASSKILGRRAIADFIAGH